MSWKFVSKYNFFLVSALVKLFYYQDYQIYQLFGNSLPKVLYNQGLNYLYNCNFRVPSHANMVIPYCYLQACWQKAIRYTFWQWWNMYFTLCRIALPLVLPWWFWNGVNSTVYEEKYVITLFISWFTVWCWEIVSILRVLYG